MAINDRVTELDRLHTSHETRAVNIAMDRSEVMSQFISLTNCTDNEASFYLEAANFDVDRAVAMFYGKLFF